MLRECDPSEVLKGKDKTKSKSTTYAERMVGEFVGSDMRCAEVLDFDSKDVSAVYQALRNSAIKSRACVCRKRGSRLYLLRKGY